MSDFQFFSKGTVESIREAAAALSAGHLVAFPTETVYGLGADARNPEAVKRIYEVKGRPSDHPLIVHISSINQLEKWANDIPRYAISLAREFWPGPMTLILKRTDFSGDFITGGQDAVGIRVPSNPLALALIAEFEKATNSAIVAPSANRFGQVSPTSSSDVYQELGEYLADSDIVLDGGPCRIGVESTIIDCTQNYPRILRPGAISEDLITNLIGFSVKYENSKFEPSEIRVSGSLESHYSPLATVLLDQSPIKGQGFIALASVPSPEGVVRLASPRDDDEFAQVLYSSLRAADENRLTQVVVIQPQGDGIAIAIRDRLTRAAKSG